MKQFWTIVFSVVKAPGPEFELSCKRVSALACIIAGIVYVFSGTPDPIILGVLFTEAGTLMGFGAVTKS
jgi:hypothetical protein